MKKRILALLLVLAMSFSLTACGKSDGGGSSNGGPAAESPAVESPAAEGSEGTSEEGIDWPAPAPDDSFEFDAATGTISKYIGGGGMVVIPEKIGGAAVTAIGESCFYDDEGERDFEDPITALYVPDSVKTIGTYAFVGNQFMETLRLPKGLEKIPRSMCYLCLGLETLTIPDTVKTIGEGAFSISGLQSLSLPGGLETIEDFAFSGCEDLVLPELPEGLKTIGEKAFANCAWTPYYTIPASVESIASRAFEDSVFALNFPGVYRPDDLPKLENAKGPVFETVYLALMAWDISYQEVLDMDEFLLSQGEEEIAWVMFNPEWEEYVDHEAMSYDESGTVTAFDHEAGAEGIRVAIPREDKDGQFVITAIGDSAFENRAVSFVGMGADIQSIGKRAFAGSEIEEISFPIGLEYIGEAAFLDCDKLTSITLNGLFTELPAKAFQYSDNLQEVTLPETVKVIGAEAFSGCAFTSIVIPEGVVEIGEMAFTGCTKLESVVLPASLERLGGGVFGNCPELRSITFLGTNPPEMSTDFSSIGENATFYLPKTLTQAEFEYFEVHVSFEGVQVGATWERSE